MQSHKRFASLICIILFSIPFYPFGQANQTERVIGNPKGDSVAVHQTHEDVINMPFEKLQKQYGDKFLLVFTQHMFAEANNHRRRLGLPLLTYDSYLEEMCYRWCTIQKENNAWGHSINGKSSSRDDKYLWKYLTMHENIAIDDFKLGTIKFIVDNWLYLDDHRDSIRGTVRPAGKNHKTAIISKDVDRFGCGFAINEDTKDIWITMRSGSLFNNKWQQPDYYFRNSISAPLSGTLAKRTGLSHSKFYQRAFQPPTHLRKMNDLQQNKLRDD